MLTILRAPDRPHMFAGSYAGSALERFLRKCEHDATTGCVLWTGGKTAGRGHTALYGSFWDERRRWFAHRWAAKNIHGLDIDGLQVDHCCPLYRHGGADPLPPDTLCVEHVQCLTLADNRELQTVRAQLVAQTLDERRHWAYVQCGLLDPPPLPDMAGDVPFYVPPAWMAQ